MALSEDLLSILVCPQCKGDLLYNKEESHLTCPVDKLRFRVVGDIPVMLLDQAERLA
ncbi:MAG: Trm112 family protein [Candidatus Eiseniibacteriota bacterium]